MGFELGRALHRLPEWMTAIAGFLWSLGLVGLFLLAVGDSSFLFVPFGTDLFLIALSSAAGTSLIWIVYVAIALTGSICGLLLLDTVMRKVGEDGLEYFASKRSLDRAKKMLTKHVVWVIFGSTLAPPPFPLTAVLMAAAGLELPRRRILLGFISARLLRYSVEAYLAHRFGDVVFRWLHSTPAEYVGIAFFLLVVVGTVFSVRRLLQGRRKYRSRATAREATA